jgi:hypothetical protein
MTELSVAGCIFPRGEMRPWQTRQLPRAVGLKGRFLFLVVVKC